MHRAIKRFEEKGAQVLSASVDSQFSSKVFGMGLGGVSHPILADFHPKGQVATAFGVYNEDAGIAKRSAFVIDKEGVVRFSKEYTGSLPDVDELLAEVDKLK